MKLQWSPTIIIFQPQWGKTKYFNINQLWVDHCHWPCTKTKIYILHIDCRNFKIAQPYTVFHCQIFKERTFYFILHVALAPHHSNQRLIENTIETPKICGKSCNFKIFKFQKCQAVVVKQRSWNIL